jgi:hypothetical protein
MTEQEIAEQRRFERRAYIGLVHISLSDEIERTFPAQVLNISKGGIYVELDEDLDVDRYVYVWIKDAPEEVAREEYFGRIRWKKRLDDSFSALFGYGIEFAD